MTYSSTNETLNGFTVVADGRLDEARIDQYERDVRITMLKQYGREIGSECVKTVLGGIVIASKFIGSVTLELFEAAAEEGKR